MAYCKLDKDHIIIPNCITFTFLYGCKFTIQIKTIQKAFAKSNLGLTVEKLKKLKTPISKAELMLLKMKEAR